MLRNLASAPEFTLLDEKSRPRSLQELRAASATALVVLFFRGAFCATARRDLLTWGDLHERMRWLGADLVAISVDAPDELRRLHERLQLPFSLLSDPNFEVSQRYGIYRSDETEAGPQPHGEPGTFVLDRTGRLVFSQVQSGPKGAANAGEVLLMLLWMHNNDGNYW